jgi:hypothetical protein
MRSGPGVARLPPSPTHVTSSSERSPHQECAPSSAGKAASGSIVPLTDDARLAHLVRETDFLFSRRVERGLEMKRKRSQKHVRLIIRCIKSRAVAGQMGPGHVDATLAAMEAIHRARGVRDWSAVERAIDQLARQFLACEAT